MSTALEIEFPPTLLLHGKTKVAVEARSRFLLALKYFELDELTSGQAAAMCGLTRVQFFHEATRHGVPVSELSDDELADEFAS